MLKLPMIKKNVAKTFSDLIFLEILNLKCHILHNCG